MKRVFSALFCVLMILSLYPVNALAYSTTSNKDVELVYPEKQDYYITSFEATVKSFEGGKGIYLMPMPESGHGHLGSVVSGSKVTILAEANDYFFFVTSKGYYGWNGTRWFEYDEDLPHFKDSGSTAGSRTSPVSSAGVSLRFPSDRAYLSEPRSAIITASKPNGAIYLMPMPQKGNGNLGKVRSGEKVSLLAQEGDYYFFQTKDGRYGWNRTKFFYCKLNFVHGGYIHIPASYTDISTNEIRALHGHFYDFYNADHDMTISLSEAMVWEYPMEEENMIDEEYAFWLRTLPAPTYKAKSTDGFTLSGYSGNTIYYIQYWLVDDVVYTIEFNCPAANKDICSPIVERVCVSFSA